MGHAERLCISPDVKAETSDMLRTVFTKMGSLPWETEGAGKPASTQLNVVLIWKAQRDFFFLINSQPFFSTRSALQCSLGAWGQLRD